MKILAFSGSNSTSSINQELIKYSAQFFSLPVVIIDLRDYDIPMFSTDEETLNGHANDLMLLYNNIISYDAYMIAIPEHNGNYPAFFKNILDWITRIEQGFFKDKLILLLNASPGTNGGKSVLNIAENSFPFFKGNVIGTFRLPQFATFLVNKEILIEHKTIISELKDVIEKFEKSLMLEYTT